MWRQPLQNPLSRARDGAAHAARFAVAGQGHHPATAMLPGFQQRVGKQRQSAWLVAHLLQEKTDQTGFEGPAAQPGRLADGQPQFFLVHRADVDLAAFQQVAQTGILAAMGVEVGAQGDDHHGRPSGADRGDEVVHKRLALRLAAALGEQFLELVDYQQDMVCAGGQGAGQMQVQAARLARQVIQQRCGAGQRLVVAADAQRQLFQRVGSGGENDDRPGGRAGRRGIAVGQRLAALQGGDQPGAHDGGFAAT